METHIDTKGEKVFVYYTRGNTLISMRKEGASYFYHYDGLGSVRQLTSKERIICLIATAVYGTPLAEEVKVLSRLRDEYLLTNKWGERLVAFYYRHSPTATNFIRDNEWAKPLLRLALLPLVRITELIVKEADAAPVSNPNPNPNPNPHGSTRQRRFEVSPPQRQFNRSVSIEAEYTYDVFGTLIEGNNHDNPYGFTGEQQFNEPDGLIFLRARYYDPSVGRFISKDPILLPMIRRGHRRWMLPHIVRFPQMLHHYVYVHNNPVNLTDPTGLLPEHLLPLGFFDGGAIDCILRAYEETGRLLEEGIGDAVAHCYLSCRANRCLGLLGPVTVMMGGFLWEVAEIPDPVGYFSWPDMGANLQGMLASYNLGKSCRELCDPLYQCGQ